MAAADKIMFEIYREAGYDQKFRVVYFTELDEHNKHNEINRAMSGEHFFDGFLKELNADAGKARINEYLQRLNSGESLTPDEIEAGLSETGVLAD
ncbi:MAG TPA: hypothetical protein P5081_00485 [Phycisphaerae bacterium]|nr:hypothetical protein [Phycisphaerae bacterium]HRW51330.1 hypothetical protein [Phycisphaerae bacterium]